MFEPEKKCMVVELESKIDHLSNFYHAFKFTFMIIYSTLTRTCVKLLSMYVQYILQFLLQFLKADKWYVLFLDF